MPLYESVLIARQDISASQADALADDFSKSIEENGGKVVSRENWGLRTLAYRIKKNRKGHYILLNIDAPAATIQEMERQMRLHEYILRFLTLKVDELATEPSLMVQNLAPRDERPHHAGGGGGDDVNDKQAVKGDDQ